MLRNGPSPHFKYHPQLKRKEGVGRGKPAMEGYQAKHSKQGCGCHGDLSQLPFPLMRVSRDLVILLFLLQRGRHSDKWSFPYKCEFPLQKGK